jgi:hypothetical protein
MTIPSPGYAKAVDPLLWTETWLGGLTMME